MLARRVFPSEEISLVCALTIRCIPVKSMRLSRHSDWIVDSSTFPSKIFREMIVLASSTYLLASLISARKSVNLNANPRIENKTSASRSFRLLLKEDRSNNGSGWQSQYRKYASAALKIVFQLGSWLLQSE
jgi:hypothetical protein